MFTPKYHVFADTNGNFLEPNKNIELNVSKILFILGATSILCLIFLVYQPYMHVYLIIYIYIPLC